MHPKSCWQLLLLALQAWNWEEERTHSWEPNEPLPPSSGAEFRDAGRWPHRCYYSVESWMKDGVFGHGISIDPLLQDTYYSLSLYPTVSMVRQTQFLYMFCFVLYHLISVMFQWRGARKLRHTVLMCLFTGLFPNGYNLAQVVWRCVQNMCGRNGVELSLGFGLIFWFGCWLCHLLAYASEPQFPPLGMLFPSIAVGIAILW